MGVTSLIASSVSAGARKSAVANGIAIALGILTGWWIVYGGRRG